MEVFDKDIQFLKDIFADNDKREITKRVVTIALGRLGQDIPIDIALALGDELDNMLLEQAEETRQRDKNLPV